MFLRLFPAEMNLLRWCSAGCWMPSRLLGSIPRTLRHALNISDARTHSRILSTHLGGCAHRFPFGARRLGRSKFTTSGRRPSPGKVRSFGKSANCSTTLPIGSANISSGSKGSSAVSGWVPHQNTGAWRQRFAERIATAIDPVRFGVRAVYLFGSTEAGNADTGSDIDLIVVRDGDPRQRRDLQMWLEGWSLCLAEISFQLYGVPSHGLLDVKYLDSEEAQLEIPSFSRAGKTLQALPVGTSIHSTASRK